MINLSVKVNLNRIPTSYDIFSDFETARLYFLKHGVNINWSFTNTDLHGYISVHSSIPFQNTILERWLIQGSWDIVTIDPTADINIFVFDEAEWTTPIGSQFPLLPNTPTGFCFNFNGKPFINIPSYIVDHNDGQQAIVICHELMHALTIIANAKGFSTVDQLDTYFENGIDDLPNSNFMIQWSLLTPYLMASQSTTMPTTATLPLITIKRLTDNGTECIGQLRSSDGKFGCDTLERSYKNNQQNISAIPIGNYICKWKFMFRELSYRYQVMNVPNRSGIFFHAGNFFFDSKGCIILGSVPHDINNDGQMDLVNSTSILKSFEKYMGKKDFTLQII